VDVLVFDGIETPFMKKLKDQGVKVFSLGKDENVYSCKNIKKLVPIIKQYDIVHTHNTACQMYVAIAKKLSGVKCKLVTTEHSTDNRRRHHRFFKPIDRWMYSQYDTIISISNIAEKILRQYIGENYKILTIPNGVKVDKYFHAEPYTDLKGKDDIIVIMVAAFRVGKQQETLIRMLQHLPVNYKVWLVGDGVRRQECEQLAKDLRVADRVKFWGVRTDVPRLLKTADVVVMSTHYEGMSLSNIEGMASGRPFVASNVKGIREITEGAGVMFEEKNDQQLADIIQHLMIDNSYYSEVVQRCLARAKEFDVSKTAEGYLNIYRKIETLDR
jgi:glycosyltransferase involved in cell wall biosynthesis